jgi:lysozyme family protein
MDRLNDRLNVVISDVLRREGGARFTVTPGDSGGPTKYGITQATLSRHRGKAATLEDVRNLTETEARAIYRQRFVVAPGFLRVLDLSQPIGEEMVDTGANAGPARATTMLQQALNGLNRNGADYADVPEDGECGPATINALAAFLRKRGREGEIVLTRALNCLQGSFYIDLARRRPKDEAFLYGWLRERVA